MIILKPPKLETSVFTKLTNCVAYFSLFVFRAEIVDFGSLVRLLVISLPSVSIYVYESLYDI